MDLGYVVKYTKVCLGSVKQVRNTTKETAQNSEQSR